MGKAARNQRRQAQRAAVQLTAIPPLGLSTVQQPQQQLSAVETALRGVRDPLDALAVLHEISREARRLEALQIKRARAAGATWGQIGAALGVTPQAAQQRTR